MRRVILLLAGLASAATGNARAEEVLISLHEAVDLALSGNQSLLATRARALAAQARADQTNRLLWPQVALNSRWSRTDDAATVFMGKLTSGIIEERDFAPDVLNDPRPRSHLRTRLSIEAPLDPFGRLRPLKAATRSLAGSAEAVSREHTLEVRQRVNEAYARAALSRERILVIEAAVVAARAREAEVDAQVREGAALRADLLRVRARRRERESELAALLAERAGALAMLNEILGATGETTYVPAGLPAPTPGPLEDEHALLSRALLNRPALDALRLQVEAADRSAEADRRARLPEIGAFAQLSDDRGGFSEAGQSYAIGAFLRVSLFDPARSARQAEARIRAHAAELDLLAGIGAVRRAVHEAYEQVRARLAAVEAARGGAEEGQEALRVVQERRREGFATLTDELETEAAALDARLRELSTQVELAVAGATLARITGETR